MSNSFAYALIFFVSISFSLTTEIGARAQPPQRNATDTTLDQLWSDLLEAEPTCTQAVLKLSKQPGVATQFLAAKLPPLKLSGQDLLDAIWRLGSDEEQEWRDAYQKLNYFDPRLAMGLEEILALEAVKEFPARNRLVDILSDRSVDAPYSATSMRYASIILHKFNDDGQECFNFVGSENPNGGGVSWWAEPKVEALNEGFLNPKREWTRIARSLALLESFDTPEAYAVIETMASGHPEAQPTRIAQSMLAARAGRQ